MLRGPVDAANTVERYVRVTDPPRSVDDVLQEIIVGENGLDPLDAADRVGAWKARFLSKLDHKKEQAIKSGSFLTFCFNSTGANFIQGACFVEPRDTEAVKREKESRAKHESYLDLFSELSPTEFEGLCGKVIHLLRVDEASVTRASADQGVDFYGRLPLGSIIKPSEISPGAEKNLCAWIVGQAKHYQKTSVSTKDIRELVGSVELAKSKVFAGTADPLQGLDIRVCDPVVFLFITTGRFTRDSRDLLARSGVVSMDGIQLSVFLADHEAAQDNGELALDALQAWIIE